MLLKQEKKLTLVEELVVLGLECENYIATTRKQWEEYFVFCLINKFIFLYFCDKKLIGFFSWYKTDTYKEFDPMQKEGKYIVANILYIKKEYRQFFKIRHLIRTVIKSLEANGQTVGNEKYIWRRLGRKRMRELKGGLNV